MVAQAGRDNAQHRVVVRLDQARRDAVADLRWVGPALCRSLDGGAGSGRFAWENDAINGYNAFSTDSLAASNGGSSGTAFDVLFGLWKAAYIGQWGGMELIVDPYTYALEGEYRITANGLFDTSVSNPLHFAAIRNATV